MRIKSNEVRSKVNSKSCSVNEYDFPFKNLGIAIVKINGRYPDSGKAMNTECDEIYYVISGSAVIHTAEGDFKINKNDAFYFEKNKWYWVEGKHLEILLPTSPSWFPEQYRQID